MKRLTLLSGGEKSMTAIGFLFAVFLAKPCPFYILDEVEAALDDPNITRFLDLLRRYADRAQFIVVTHQKRTMEAADTLYGVSMGDDGVSKVVSRRLPREEAAEARAAPGRAAPRDAGRAGPSGHARRPAGAACADRRLPALLRQRGARRRAQRRVLRRLRGAERARDADRRLRRRRRASAGYTCLYWTFSSISATDVVLLNDLYVRPARRGARVGEALVAAARRRRPRARLLAPALVHRAATTAARSASTSASARERVALFEYEIDLR